MGDLGQATGSTEPHAGGQLHVRAYGDRNAQSVVLLHAGVADGRAWEPIAQRLADAGLHVLVPDLRGFGRSPDPGGDFRHADDVLAMLDAHGVDDRPIALVGWSMSGTIALDLALEHPDRVLVLALVCSVPEGMPRSRAVLESWEREDALLEAGDVEGAIRNDVATWGAGPTRGVDALAPELVAYMEGVARDQYARGDRATGEALDGDRDAIDRLGELACPLLVVTAEHDTPCQEEAAMVLATAAPHVTTAHVDDAAHLAPLEQPDAVGDALLAFIGAHAATSVAPTARTSTAAD